jgi:phosphoribosylaminoimidazole carboxylase (NCAIR synthetase)
VGGAVMKNILGDGDGPEAMQKMHDVMGAALRVPGANVHWYDKPAARAGRKMGHLTVTANHATVGLYTAVAFMRSGELTHARVQLPTPTTSVALEAAAWFGDSALEPPET